MGVPHVIPYQGSKRLIAPHILRWFPPTAHRLIEPFAGSAAVALAALHHEQVEQVVLGDTDSALVALWERIIDAPEALADAYAALWEQQRGLEQSFYNQVRAAFNLDAQPEMFLFLLARCVKAAVRYNANGQFNQSPDNRRRGTHPDTMRERIRTTSALLRGRVTLVHADYQTLLAQATPKDVVYLDPPYQGVSRTRDPRYKAAVLFDEFMAVLHALNQRQVSYIVSYDGRTGSKNYGQSLPASLKLQCIEIDAGRSSQATLLGRDERTTEAIYLSPALLERSEKPVTLTPQTLQYTLPFPEPS
ncbi:MAG: DNA adenine methylase [bacterium]|nr:DNA adenine methylase [bacterium]